MKKRAILILLTLSIFILLVSCSSTEKRTKEIPSLDLTDFTESFYSPEEISQEGFKTLQKDGKISVTHYGDIGEGLSYAKSHHYEEIAHSAWRSTEDDIHIIEKSLREMAERLGATDIIWSYTLPQGVVSLDRVYDFDAYYLVEPSEEEIEAEMRVGIELRKGSPGDEVNLMEAEIVFVASPADRAGVKRGDVIISVNGNGLMSPEAYYEAIEGAIDDEIRIIVERGGKTIPLVITLPTSGT